MKNCKCGVNQWQWKCEGGMMQGTCASCGNKTNKFKANGKRRKEENKI